ncbi:penicillin-binding transpeptidase domain-containing protein [Candidatus Latescibacterota bacterium]
MQTGHHITRQKFAMVIVFLLWITMAGRIGIIQIMDHDELSDDVLNQSTRNVTLEGKRGSIYDSNGVRLAMNLESASYALRSDKIENPDEAVHIISGAIGIKSSKIRNMIESKKSFQWLVRQADSSVIEELDKANLPCVEKIPNVKRYYPLGRIASQIIGYTDIDGKGIEGCEYYFNGELAGHNGRSIVKVDARQRVTSTFDKPIIEPQNGSDINLTLDWRIQEIAEEELESAVEKWNAVSGGAIVLNTETGDILCMANVPRFNPNDPSFFDANKFNPEFRKNKLATDMIEPGSTFKIVPFIEALESRIINEDDLIDCENGKYKIGNHIINDSHKMDIVLASEVFIHSSNIGTVKISEKIGKKKLYERARLMGFGEITGFDLLAETPGKLVEPRNWSKLSLPTISFGQGVSVSPIQISMAYAAIANGGILLSPKIVKSFREDGNHNVITMGKKEIRRSMTKETAERMTTLLCKTVETGTGMNAAIPGIRIAGKTGTAQKVIEGKKGYAPGLYISSFIGFIADRDPKILCFVIIDSPKGVHYGSQIAAPVFKNIMVRILNMGGSTWANMVADADEVSTDHAELIVVPDMIGKGVREAVGKLIEIGFDTVVVGDSTQVAQQSPMPGAELNVGEKITLYSNVVTGEKKNEIKVPNLKGKTLREAIQHLVQLNLAVNVNGSGIVESQYPKAGSVVKYGTVCTIACSKRYN